MFKSFFYCNTFKKQQAVNNQKLLVRFTLLYRSVFRQSRKRHRQRFLPYGRRGQKVICDFVNFTPFGDFNPVELLTSSILLVFIISATPLQYFIFTIFYVFLRSTTFICQRIPRFFASTSLH